jgi:hypothetical protein
LIFELLDFLSQIVKVVLVDEKAVLRVKKDLALEKVVLDHKNFIPLADEVGAYYEVEKVLELG